MEDGGETGEGHCPGRVGTPAAGLGGGTALQAVALAGQKDAGSEREEGIGGAMGDLVMLEPELSWRRAEYRLGEGDELYL